MRQRNVGGCLGPVVALFLFGLLASAVVVAGCSGDGEEPAQTTISKAEFIARANAVCKKARANLGEEIARYRILREGEEPRAYTDLVHAVWLPTVEAEIAAIESLPAPEGERERIADLLDIERREASDIAVKPRVASIARAERHFTKADRLFTAYGLDGCANGHAR